MLQLNEQSLPATEEQIRIVEAHIGRGLPPEYREFLASHNGAWINSKSSYFFPEPDDPLTVHLLLGIDQDHKYSNLIDSFDVFRQRIPDDLLPIGSDPFGNVYCIGLYGDRYSAIYFWDHETSGADQYDSDVEKIADSFTVFLEGIGPDPRNP